MLVSCKGKGLAWGSASKQDTCVLLPRESFHDELSGDAHRVVENLNLREFLMGEITEARVGFSDNGIKLHVKYRETHKKAADPIT